jgi:hypothetical protein
MGWVEEGVEGVRSKEKKNFIQKKKLKLGLL